jgi:hypothetical protein
LQGDGKGEDAVMVGTNVSRREHGTTATTTTPLLVMSSSCQDYDNKDVYNYYDKDDGGR